MYLVISIINNSKYYIVKFCSHAQKLLQTLCHKKIWLCAFF